jgi:hypothetical protein
MKPGTTRHPAAPDDGERGIGARLAALVDQQHALFVELESLCERQASLIESDASAELLGHLEARREIVERIVRVSGELEPYRARWDSLIALVSPEHAERVRSRLDEVSRIAARVREIDEDGERRLRGKRDALGVELRGVERARLAGDAYIIKRAPRPRFQDREA